MKIWKDNEIKKAYSDMLYAQQTFNKQPDYQNWLLFCAAYKEFATVYGKEIGMDNCGSMYSTQWIDQ